MTQKHKLPALQQSYKPGEHSAGRLAIIDGVNKRFFFCYCVYAEASEAAIVHSETAAVATQQWAGYGGQSPGAPELPAEMFQQFSRQRENYDVWGPIYKISYDNLTIILRQCQTYDRLTTASTLQNILRRTQGLGAVHLQYRKIV